MASSASSSSSSSSSPSLSILPFVSANHDLLKVRLLRHHEEWLKQEKILRQLSAFECRRQEFIRGHSISISLAASQKYSTSKFPILTANNGKPEIQSGWILETSTAPRSLRLKMKRKTANREDRQEEIDVNDNQQRHPNHMNNNDSEQKEVESNRDSSYPNIDPQAACMKTIRDYEEASRNRRLKANAVIQESLKDENRRFLTSEAAAVKTDYTDDDKDREQQSDRKDSTRKNKMDKMNAAAVTISSSGVNTNPNPTLSSLYSVCQSCGSRIESQWSVCDDCGFDPLLGSEESDFDAVNMSSLTASQKRKRKAVNRFGVSSSSQMIAYQPINEKKLKSLEQVTLLAESMSPW